MYQEWGLDFYSYYLSSIEFRHGINPYHIYLTKHPLFPTTCVLVPNPNPPLALLLMSAFSYFSYIKAYVAWATLSTLLGLIGVYQTLLCFYKKLDKNTLFLCVILYLAAFPVLENAALAQVGGIMLFLLASGYRAFLNSQDFKAGFWWGLLIALKLFPALLVIFAFLKARYRLCFALLLFSIGFTFLPLLSHDKIIYQQYMNNVNELYWYGINWNGSILGILYKYFVTLEPYKIPYLGKTISMMQHADIRHAYHVKLVFICISLAIIGLWVFFFKKLEDNLKHRDFAFLVVLMLLVSPFAWIYYFPMLLIPLTATFEEAKENSNYFMLWFLCLLFLYFPMPIMLSSQVNTTFWEKLTIYSMAFYGLMLLAYLTLTIKHDPHDSPTKGTLSQVYIKYSLIGVTSLSLLFLIMRVFVLIVLYVTGVRG